MPWAKPSPYASATSTEPVPVAWRGSSRSTDAAMKRYHKQGAMALWYRPPPQDDISTTDYNSFRRRIANQIVQLTGDRKAN